jgi:hypothetical protein
VFIFHYLQTGNEPILDAFKNNFDMFLVFWDYFKNIMQHKKYVELRKKRDDGYDFKIFIVINHHEKHPYVFLSMIQLV